MAIQKNSISATQLANLGKCERVVKSPFIKKPIASTKDQELAKAKGNLVHDIYEKDCQRFKQPSSANNGVNRKWIIIVFLIIVTITLSVTTWIR